MAAKAVLALILIVNFIFISFVQGYGEPDANGHPNYFERANLVFTNIARISPLQYKSIYLTEMGTKVDQSAVFSTYTAVPPIYFEPKLINSAYAHSLDMATKNCFSHPSCDGTDTFVRVKQYYTCSGTLGENIAAGNTDPLSTNNQWICDQSGSACAGDKSGADGHRSSIMNAKFTAIGIGYGYTTTSTYKSYWTQDFGGTVCDTSNTSPVPSGSHRVKSPNTKFLAIYYTSPAVAPASAIVNIDGTDYSLTLETGVAGAGTYTFSQTSGTACRNYYFKFGSVRYPQTGYLVTYNEGTCKTDFVAGSTSTSAPTNPATVKPTTPATSSPTKAPTSCPTKTPTSSPTKTPTSSPTKTPTSSPTIKPTPAPTVAPTTSPSTRHYLYQNGPQNSWSAFANSGATVTTGVVYSAKNSVKAVLTTSSSSKYFMFKRNSPIPNVYTSFTFSAASTGNVNLQFYVNGGYVQTLSLTTGWKTFSFTLSQIGPAFSTLSQFNFQNAGSSSVTYYVADVFLQ